MMRKEEKNISYTLFEESTHYFSSNYYYINEKFIESWYKNVFQRFSEYVLKSKTLVVGILLQKRKTKLNSFIYYKDHKHMLEIYNFKI